MKCSLKRNRAVKHLLFFSALMICSADVYAGSWVRDAKIASVRWYPSSGYGFISTDIASNPEGCSKGDGHRYFDSTQNGHDKLLSIALTALTTGKTVDVWLNGCNSATGYNKLDGLIIKAE